MTGWRAENKLRRELLAGLAGELRPASGCEYPARSRLGLTWRLRPYLSARPPGCRRLRVYCAGTAGRYVLLTSSGQVIRLDEGVAAAAAAIMAGCGCRQSGESAASKAAAAQPGP